MATDNNIQYGVRWVRTVNGDSNSPALMRVRLATAYAPTVGGTGVNLHAGDVIQIASTGYGTISIGTEGTQSLMYGVIAGFSPEYDGSVMQPRDRHVSGQGAYSTNYERLNYVWVIPIPGNVFEMDCDDATTFTTEATYLAAIGENCDMVCAANTSNAGDPRITTRLDISTHAVTNTLQWRIEDISPTQENKDFAGNYVKLLVTGNKLQQSPYAILGV